MRVLPRFLIPPLLLMGAAGSVGALYLAPAVAQEPVRVISPRPEPNRRRTSTQDSIEWLMGSSFIPTEST